MSETVETAQGTTQADDHRQAYKEAAIELGKGIAIGLVPFVGQAIDAYDTVESAIALYQANQQEQKENAQFDFLLAIVGWIPGPGDGVKKSLRIVNRDPQRFAPVLFELLRFVLTECGVETSPEALLDQIFSTSKLKAQIEEIKAGVLQSSVYTSLPQSMQTVVRTSLEMAASNMPALVGVVETRLTKWKRMQANSSARELPHGKAKQPPPKAKDAEIAKKGDSTPAHGHADTNVNGTLATRAADAITNEILGISGEHIADYICAETFGWGKDWKGHDDGTQGRWTEGTPSKTKLGKLSKGGSPKAAHVLYKLSDGANGTGIDAVWRAEGHNGGKPYAIVEAKATRDEDAPKFMRKINNTRKPSITSTLGVNGITDPSELIEPLEDEGQSSTPNPTNKKGGGKTGGGKGGKATAPITGQSGKIEKTGSSSGSTAAQKVILVQMSHDWIDVNLDKAVGDIAGDIRRRGYFRHLFFSPKYHLSGSPKAHMDAKVGGSGPTTHAFHDAFHYNESEIQSAVNKRKASLRKRYGGIPGLKAEI